MTDKMDKTTDEIFQELQDHVIFLRDKVKQADYKHYTNVMTCGHGQYPKHLEIKITAELYKDALTEYLALKQKILNLFLD